MLDLSLEQTRALLDIVESGDMSRLEEFVAERGYDEGSESDLYYRTITVSYQHRFVGG